MLTPELVAEFIRAFADELQVTQRERRSSGRASSGSGDTERGLAGILRAIEGGAWNDSLRARLDELEARKKALTADASPPRITRRRRWRCTPRRRMSTASRWPTWRRR